MLSARDNEKPNSVLSWEVMEVDNEHQNPGTTDLRFVDHGEKEVSEDTWRRVYQLPEILKDSDDTIRCLMRNHPPQIKSDATEVPIRSIYLAKLGLLAIGYENEADQRAQAAWQTYWAESGLSQKREDGLKRRHVKFSTAIRRKPNNFM